MSTKTFEGALRDRYWLTDKGIAATDDYAATLHEEEDDT